MAIRYEKELAELPKSGARYLAHTKELDNA